MPTAYVYSRVSTNQQVPGLSLDAQEDRARARAQADGHRDIRIVRDAGVSGRSMARPGIAGLLEQIRDGDSIYVWSISRLGRNVREVLHLVEEVIIPRQIKLVSLTEPMDTSTPIGKCIIAILASLAQLQREEIAGDIRRGVEERVKRGHHWGVVPYGYKPKDGRMVVDDELAPVIRQMYELAAAGATRGEIARTLNEEGAPTRTGQPWGYSTVKRILANPAYVGLMTYRGELLDAIHEPLVTQELFDAVQQAIRARACVPAPSRAESWAPLYRCALCDSRICAITGGSHPGKRQYDCARQSCLPHSQRHEPVRTMAHKADHWLWEAVVGTIAEDTLRRWQLSVVDAQQDSEASQERAELTAQRDRAVSALDRNSRAYVEGLMPEATYAELNRQLMDELHEVEQRLGELATAAELIEGAAQVAAGGREMLYALDRRERRDLLLRLIDRVAVAHNSLTVHWALPTVPRMHIALPRVWGEKRQHGTAQITYLPTDIISE